MADKKNGKSRPPRNRGQLLFEFDMRRDASQDVRQYFVGDAYPPSTKSIDDLETFQLSDLQVDTHHRGKALVIRTAEDGVHAAAIQTIVEDKSGAVERLAVYNAYALAEAGDLVSKDVVLAIKEPFLEENATGAICVRVDHPSDLVFLPQIDPRVPEAFRMKQNEAPPSAADWKAKGNRFYKADKYTDAVRAFGNGLDCCGPSDGRIRCDILRNRAIANTLLKRFELALTDATAAMILDDDDDDDDEQVAVLNSKAHFRAGRAAYELRDFEEARSHFAKALELAPKDQDAAREVQRTQQRLEEREKGSFDFLKMNELVSKRRNRLDHADFLLNTAKRDAGGRGRGLFASKDIKAGELVLCEKAFAVAFDSDQAPQDFSLLDSKSQRRVSGTQALLLFNAIAKMQSNPTKVHEFFDLHDGDYALGTSVERTGGSLAIDTFRAQAVLAHNNYGCPTTKTSSKAAKRQAKSEAGYSSTGLWTTISYINHACNGNTMRSFIGDVMILRATRDISKGEEILMPYRLPGPDNSITQAELQKIWGFKCDCSLCLAEADVPASQRRLRSQLLKECTNLQTSNPATGAKAPTKKVISLVEKLHGDIEQTYDDQGFQQKPRMALVPSGVWLCQACTGQKVWSKSADSALGVLRNLGFVVTVSDGGKSIGVDRSHCLLVEDAVDAALYAAWAYENLAKAEVQKEMLAFASGLYEILNGEMQGFEEKFNELKQI